jgi:hypothetical protein
MQIYTKILLIHWPVNIKKYTYIYIYILFLFYIKILVDTKLKIVYTGSKDGQLKAIRATNKKFNQL